MATVSVSARIDQEDSRLLAQLAEATDRAPSYHVSRAIHEYVAKQAWQVQETARAVQQADRGEFASEEDVSALLETMRKRGDEEETHAVSYR